MAHAGRLSPSTAGQVAQGRAWRLSASQRRFLLGLAFVSPWLVGLVAFTAYPILASLYYSFTRYDVINAPVFVGLDNYAFMLGQDRTFLTAVYNTVYVVAIGVPAAVVVAFLLAALLNNDIRGRPLFRTFFFMPALVPTIAVAMVWLWFYDPNYGLANASLAGLGMPAIPWLSSPGSRRRCASKTIPRR
jgi:multiple sugar transport system permease protein